MVAKNKYWDGLVWQEIGASANKVTLLDIGNKIIATDVEGALQEHATQLAETASNVIKNQLHGTVLAVNGTDATYIANMKTLIDRSVTEYGIDFFIIPILYRVDDHTTNTEIYVFSVTSDDVAYELVDYIHINHPSVTVAINLYLTAMDGYGADFAPTDIPTWFTTWKNICVANAVQCQSHNVDYIGIDNENKNLTITAYKSYWEDIVNTIHTYNVLVFNSSNYSEWLTSCMAELVDIIGFNFYPSLTLKGLNETDLEMKRALYFDLYGVNWIQKIIDLSQYNKPIWLTEIGCSANLKALESTGTTYSWSGLGYATYADYVTAECNLNIPAFYMEYILAFIGNLKSVNGVALFAVNGLEPDWSYIDNLSGEVVKKYWVGV